MFFALHRLRILLCLLTTVAVVGCGRPEHVQENGLHQVAEGEPLALSCRTLVTCEVRAEGTAMVFEEHPALGLRAFLGAAGVGCWILGAWVVRRHGMPGVLFFGFGVVVMVGATRDVVVRLDPTTGLAEREIQLAGQSWRHEAFPLDTFSGLATTDSCALETHGAEQCVVELQLAGETPLRLFSFGLPEVDDAWAVEQRARIDGLLRELEAHLEGAAPANAVLQ